MVSRVTMEVPELAQRTVQRHRWRAQPLREIFYAWTGLLWAAPIVSVLAILVASAMHTWELYQPIARFLAMTSYTTFVFVFLFAWNVIPLTLAIIFLTRHRDVALGLIFWFTLTLAHIFRFFAATSSADLFFSGLTGPGVGPSLDVLCTPDAAAELKCAELADIEQSVFWVSACLSLILFALDVRKMRAPIGNCPP
jgi:hypothetical protein